MSFTIKATYKNQNKTVQFDTAGIPPHAIINAKLRDAFDLPSDFPVAWWHIYMSLDDGIPGAKFLRHVCSEEEYEGAAEAYRKAGVEFPNPTLTLQVLPLTDAKLNSAKKFHSYLDSASIREGLENEEQSMKVAVLALQTQLASLVSEESKLDEEDYQGRLQILQKRAEKMSEVATLKQNMKAVGVELNNLMAIHEPNMSVVERELNRNSEAKQETHKMITTWKNRAKAQEVLRKRDDALKKAAAARSKAVEDAREKIASSRSAAAASYEKPPRATRDTSKNGPRRVPSPVSGISLRMPGGLPSPPKPTVSNANAKAEPARSAPPPRSLWEDHPVHGQVPSAYAAFPDINMFETVSSGRPLGAPLRSLSELLRDVGPLSQAISTQAQTAAQAAHAQVQKQVKETTGAVASDLKHVLEGFLSNLGGQLATFEEGFKERLETAVPKPNAAGPPAQQARAVSPETKPDVKVHGPKTSHIHSHTGLKSFTFQARLCDGCDENPTLINFKCNDCRDFDLCLDCLPRHAQNPDLHEPDHVFKMLIHPSIAGKITPDASRPVGASTTKKEVKEEAALESHNAYCDICVHDNNIEGTRYNCLQCPDWDCCEKCYATVNESHPYHDLVAIRKADDHIVRKLEYKTLHLNIRCDHCDGGVLGVRYKCAHPDCPDFDLCEDCEASPDNGHPADHPMIKFKVPCDIAIQTHFANDFVARNAQEQAVQTEAEEQDEDDDEDEEVKPKVQTPSVADSIETFATEGPEDVTREADRFEKAMRTDCSFVGHVTIPDYFCMLPNANFTKIWTMRNTGDVPIEGDYTIRLVSGHSFGSISETITLQKVQPDSVFTIQLPHRTVPVAEQSFSGAFRLHDDQGKPFGDELEVKIQVAKPDMSELGSSSLLMPRSDPESSAASGTSVIEPASAQPSPSIAPVPSSSGWGARTPEFSDDDLEIISIAGGPSEFELVDDSDSEF